MTDETKTRKPKRFDLRKTVICVLVLAILAALGFTAGALLQGSLYPDEGAAEAQLRQQLLDSKVEEISITGTLYLHGPVQVNGEKTIKGSGKLKAVGPWEGAEQDYILVLQSGANITLAESVTIDANNRSGGVYVPEDGQLLVQDEASVKKACEALSNVMAVGSFTMTGGELDAANGHNLYVGGNAIISGGQISGSGENYAGIYDAGLVEQMGGIVSDAYDNVYVAENARFVWSGGDNNDSENDGILVAQGASMTANSLGAMMNDAGKQGIHVYGEATLDDVFLVGSHESQLKIEQTGVVTLNNGALDAGLGHGITNRGTLTMTGGEVTNSGECGIVNTGVLEISGGRVYASDEHGILLRNGTEAKLYGETLSVTGNYVGVLVEENANVEIYNCNVISNELYNFASYGELYMHDLTTGGSGSNCINVQFRGHVVAENVTISGTSRNNGIYNCNGSTIELYNVTIDAAKSNAIRTLDATLIADGLTITNSGNHGISMSDYVFQGAGKVSLKNVTMENNGGANLALEADCTGTMEVSNATLGKSGSNNLSVKGGHLILTDVDVLGNMEKDASNHGILMDEGGKITATNVLICDTLKSGLRNRGGIFEGENVTMKNLGLDGLSNVPGPTNKTCGSITINNFNISGATEANVKSECEGTITLTNATLGKCGSNSVRIPQGVVTLKNVDILGHASKTKSEQEHGIFIDGGKLIATDVTIQDTKAAGIRHKGGVLTGADITITNAGTHAVSSGAGNNSGTITIDGIEIKDAGQANIYMDGENTVNIINGILHPTYTNNIRVIMGQLSLKNVQVLGQSEETKSNSEHGIFIDGGKVTAEEVIIQDTKAAGIRHKGGDLVAKGLTIQNTGSDAISSSDGNVSGSVTLEDLEIKDSGKTNIYVDGSNTVTVTGGKLHPTHTNNIRIIKGAVSLTNVEILGHTPETTSKGEHGIFIDGGKLVAKSVAVQDTAGCGLRHKGGTVEAEDLSVTNTGAAAISCSDGIQEGSMTVKGLTVSGAGAQNVVNDSSMNISISGAELGVVTTNNSVTVNNGTVSLSDVTFLGTEGDGHHGLFINGGTVDAKNLVFSDTHDALRVDGGKITVDGVQVNNARRHGVNMSKGELSLKNAEIQEAGEYGIYNYGDGAVLTAQNVTITNVSKNGIRADTGEFTISNVSVTDPGSDGIEIKGGVFIANDLNVDSARYALRISGGEVEINGGELKNTTKSTVAMDKGDLVLQGVKITDSGEDGINTWGDGEKEISLKDVQITGSRKNGMIITTGIVYVEGDSIISGNGDHGINNKGTLYLTDGYIYGNNQNNTGRKAVNNEGDLTIGKVTIGYDAQGADQGGQIYSKNLIEFSGSAVSDIHVQSGKALRLDVTGKTSGTALVKFKDNSTATSLMNSFYAQGEVLSVTGDTLYLAAGAVAQVGQQKYMTLEDAVAAAQNGSDKTVVLVDNVTVNETVSITGDVTVTDDGSARKIIRGTADTMFSVTGSLTLKSDGGLTVDGAKLSSGNSAIKVESGAVLNIDSGVKITDVVSTVKGGVVHNYGTLNIDGAAFTGNTAPAWNSGALALEIGSSASIKNASVSKNTGVFLYADGAAADGSWYTIENSTFTENSVDGGGSVLYTNAAVKIRITGSTFEKNTATNMGGALYFEKSATAEITGSTFKNNSASSHGGAVLVRNKASVTFTNCTFEGNKNGGTTVGGAIAVGQGSNHGGTVTVNGGSFTNNTSTGHGGAIGMIGGSSTKSQLTVSDAIFSGNLSKSGQGNDVGARDANCIVKLSAPTAASQMDVFITSGAVTVTGTMKDGSLVTLNWGTIPTGDAVVFDNAEAAKLNMDNVTLAATTALAGKNLVCDTGAKAAKIVTGDVAKIGNTSYATLAEAFAAVKDGQTITLTANGVLDSTVNVSGNVTVTDDGMKRTILRGTELTGKMFNVTGQLNIVATGKDKLVIDGNDVAATGNVIAVGNGATLTVKNALIDGLHSGTYNNAALYFNTGSTVSISSTTVKNTVGAVIYAQGAPAANTVHSFENCTFTGNYAAAAGAVFNSASGAKFQIKSCVFESNSSSNGGHGGVIYVDRAEYQIENCTFKNNSAAGKGGGAITVASNNASKLMLTGCTFDGNSADKGGAIWFRGNTHADTAIKNCIFKNNKATGNGGAILADGSAVVTITGTTFADNSAANGPDIHKSAGAAVTEN